MNTKKLIVIALTLTLAFALAACGGNDPAPPPEDTPGATETPATPEPPKTTEDPPPGAPEDPTPPEPVWGPLTAEFLDLLAGRNYYIYIQYQYVTADSDSDIELGPYPSDLGWAMGQAEVARQDDMYAQIGYPPLVGDVKTHSVFKDNKRYVIIHKDKRIVEHEYPRVSADDSLDVFPVSLMSYIDSGVGSVNGVTMPYEDYAITGKTRIYRFYVNDDKVAHCGLIDDGEVNASAMTFLEISPDIPSDMFEFPANYTIKEAEPRNSSEIPPERTPPE